MDDTAAFFVVVAVYGLVLAILIDWIVFVVRQRWGVGNRMVIGALGEIVFVAVASYLAFYVFASLVGAPAANPGTPTLVPFAPVG